MKIPTYMKEYCDGKEEKKRRKQGEKQNKKFKLIKIK